MLSGLTAWADGSPPYNPVLKESSASTKHCYLANASREAKPHGHYLGAAVARHPGYATSTA